MIKIFGYWIFRVQHWKFRFFMFSISTHLIIKETKKTICLIIVFFLFCTTLLWGQSLSAVYNHIAQNEYATAFQILKSMLPQCGNDQEIVEILFLLGQCADNANDASFYYKEILQEKESAYLDRAFIHLAKINLTHKDWSSAIKYSNKLLKKSFSLYYSEALFIDAQAHFCNAEYFPAITSYKEFINISLDSAQRELAMLNCGTAYYELKQYSKAIDQFSQMQEENPNSNFNPYMLYLLGLCYENREVYADAITHYKKLTNDHPYSQYSPLAEQQLVFLIEQGHYSSSLTTLPQIDELINKKYIVQLAALESSTKAHKAQEEYKNIGVKNTFIFTKSVNGKIYYAVGVGPYSTENEAIYKKKLLAEKNISSYVYKKP